MTWCNGRTSRLKMDPLSTGENGPLSWVWSWSVLVAVGGGDAAEVAVA